jgi:tetratricopeptide (TPR) repeat protein
LAVALFGSGALAAPPPDPAIAEARKHFADGSKAYNLGEFDVAVREYKAAYNAKPDPVFLYNIAQAYRLANDLSQALFFYRSYLRNQPNTPNRKEIDERIRQLESQIARQRVITTEPQTATVAPGSLPQSSPAPEPRPLEPVTTKPAPSPGAAPEPALVNTPAATVTPAAAPSVELSTSRAAPQQKPLYKKAWFWGVIGGVVVVAGVGVGLGLGLKGGASVPGSDLGNQRVFLTTGGVR